MCDDVLNTDDCPICFETVRTRIAVSLPCTHTLCLTCLLRLPVPQSCPMCRLSIVHLIPRKDESSSPTLVMLNVSNRGPNSEMTQPLSERVRIAEHLTNAIRNIGAAPRNSLRSSSHAIVPFDERAAFSHSIESLIDASSIGIVPSPDEDDGTSVPAS